MTADEENILRDTSRDNYVRELRECLRDLVALWERIGIREGQALIDRAKEVLGRQ